MPTEKKVLIFAVDDDLFKKLEDFRFDNRFNKMSEPIRRLIEESLKKHEKKTKK
jgi:hypothetical protein